MRKIEIKTSPVLFPNWRIGDRIQRHKDVFNLKSQLRHGIVILRYSIWDNGVSHDTYYGDYPELYAVRWDDGSFEKSFLSHGLVKEAI